MLGPKIPKTFLGKTTSIDSIKLIRKLLILFGEIMVLKVIN
jgi:hypothetical protein